jgi:hypothetical protein
MTITNPYRPIIIKGISGYQPAATVGGPITSAKAVKRLNNLLSPAGYFKVKIPSATIVVGHGISPKLDNKRSHPLKVKPSP